MVWIRVLEVDGFGEKRLGLGYILKGELIGFFCILDMGYKRKV